MFDRTVLRHNGMEGGAGGVNAVDTLATSLFSFFLLFPNAVQPCCEKS